MRLKKWSEAERFHRAALEAEPNHIPSHISYGTMLARNVSWKASPFFQLILKKCFPLTDYIAFFFSLWLFHFFAIQSSRSSEAEQYFKRAIRLAPLDSSVHHHYGNLSSSFSLFSACCRFLLHTACSLQLPSVRVERMKNKFSLRSLIWWIINLPFSLFHFFSFPPYPPPLSSWVPFINVKTRRSLRESNESSWDRTKWLSISNCRCDSSQDARSCTRGGTLVSSGESWDSEK